jgi:hypothetical protein
LPSAELRFPSSCLGNRLPINHVEYWNIRPRHCDISGFFWLTPALPSFMSPPTAESIFHYLYETRKKEKAEFKIDVFCPNSIGTPNE